MTLRILLALASGLLFALSFPDYSIGWLAFIAFVPLLIALVQARSGQEAFLLAWLSQTVAWLMMVPWVVRVMSHYGGLPYAVGVLLFIAMSVYLGLYGALFGYLVYRIRPHSIGRWLLVPLAWASIEYIRTYLLSGFPWNLLATSIIDYTPLIQFDRVAGPYLVGTMIFIPGAVLAWLIVDRPRGFRRMAAIAATITFVFIWWGTGLVASKLVVRPTGAAPVVAALLQPNISQEMRWNAQNTLEIFERMLAMTEEAIRGGATIVIWPESTVPLTYSRELMYRQAVESISARTGADILLGSVAENPARPDQIWNAAFLVSGGRTIGHYDKIHLVPFGEFVPMRKMLFFADKLVRNVGEFQFGTNDKPLTGRFRYGMAICYEVVFPQLVRTQVRNGADVLVTITNDAWYDGTSAPRQHLNMARLRAIENDRYLLRAATTGISAFADPSGRIVEELPMGRAGIIYARFQPRTSTTPYVRFGDWFAWMAVIAVIIASVRGKTT